jgi:hypothetical protein
VSGNVVGEQEPHAGPQEEPAEDVERPGERLDEPDADDDEQAPEHQRAHDAGEQHPVHHRGPHVHVAEDDDEDEQVVDRQRLLDDVRAEELERALRSEPEIDETVEAQAQHHPHHRPHQRLAGGDATGLSVEQPEVDGEQHTDAEQERHPQRGRAYGMEQGRISLEVEVGGRAALTSGARRRTP